MKTSVVFHYRCVINDYLTTVENLSSTSALLSGNYIYKQHYNANLYIESSASCISNDRDSLVYTALKRSKSENTLSLLRVFFFFLYLGLVFG